MAFLTAGFARETDEEWLDLKSHKGQPTAEELEARRLERLGLCLPLKAL
jgi:hypothetical protein